MPTSYALRKEFTPYLLLIMVIIVFVISMLFYAAWLGNFELVLLIFALLGIFALMIMTYSWFKKLNAPNPKKYDEHRLQ